MSSTILLRYLSDRLADLRNRGLYNEIESLESANGPIISISNKKLINMSSNNYLGLATDPRLIEAANHATKKYGVGSGAVRTINGSFDLHEKLEDKLREFKGTEAAISYQSGFMCNMAAISAIMDKHDAILSDELNHASIIDGCRLSKATVIRYKHSNMDDLRQVAQEAKASEKYNKIMVITDGVFSMDGDLAKLPDIVHIAEQYGLITYVDDAHGSGVLGGGAGTVKHFGLSEQIDLQIGTLSKAVGVVGGYVAGTRLLIDWLKVSSRPFLFSTSLPPAAVGASIAAIDIIRDSQELQQRLWDNAAYLKKGLQDLGLNVGRSETPITPCIIGDEKLTHTFSQELIKNGVYAKSIVFPTVPRGTGRIRNMPMASHTKEMLDRTLSAYEQATTTLSYGEQ